MWQVSTTERLFLVQPPSQGQLFVTPRFVGSSVHTRLLFPVMSESLGIHHRGGSSVRFKASPRCTCYLHN